jgi:hypothetical protein
MKSGAQQFDTEGTKYHPLFEHLLFSGHGHIRMTFSEIEEVLGASLPPSARRREEWWGNSPSGHSQARAWMRANYRASRVDLAAETVEFTLEGWPDNYVKLGAGWFHREAAEALEFGEEPQAEYEGSGSATSTDADHPLFGIWKGKVKLVAGFDYSKPAFEADDAP